MSEQDHELRRPELSAFVRAAREQPLVESCVTFESVQAGLEHAERRSQGRRSLVLSGVVALAASVAAVGLLWPMLSAREREAPAPATAQIEPIDTPAAATTPGPGLKPWLEPEEPAQLASAVRLRSTSSIEVRGPWSIALGEGTHEVELPPGAERALTIELPDRTLELVEGSATIEVVEHSAAVRLHTGIAAWVSAEGQRSEIQVERIEVDEKAGARRERKAAALAAEAEAHIAAGERDAAIASLRQLIDDYPRASQSRAAILDLARMLDTVGTRKEARCAYELYLERWPQAAVREEIEGRLARLRKAECEGLQVTR